MPAQKTLYNRSILINEENFFTAKQASNKQKLEACLKKLINRANAIYNTVYRSDRIEHIKNFPLCRKNYTKIKSIIDHQTISTNLIKLYYLEVELACIQSDLNALNFYPTAKKSLNLLKEDLKKIKLNFEKFNKDFI